MDKKSYFYGTGRRKTAIAKVRVMAGKGEISINDKPYQEFFTTLDERQAVVKPLAVTNSADKYDVIAMVEGGGLSGQSGAVSMGLARALVKADENLKPALKQNGLLTRDPRAKERKKPGLRRARKAPQYTKR